MCFYSQLQYSGYNLRGTIFVNHQIFHLAVIFAILKFVNHCSCVTLYVARSIYMPVAYRFFHCIRKCRQCCNTWNLKPWIYSQLNRLPILQGDVVKCNRSTSLICHHDTRDCHDPFTVATCKGTTVVRFKQLYVKHVH